MRCIQYRMGSWLDAISHHDDPMQVLSSMPVRGGLGKATIGLELDYLPSGDFQRLQVFMPDARFVGVEQDIARLCQIKTSDEIELIHKLSQIADRAICDSLAAVKAGDTELDIAAVLTRRIYELGAENFKLLIIATGERSQLPNVGSTNRVLTRGDVCRVEIFSVIAGYQAGVCRTAYVQEPPKMAEEIWQLMVDCKYGILDQIKPGASCVGVYNDFIRRLDKMKLPPISFVGHGIGLHLHEDPYIGATPTLGYPGEDALIEENMVLGFEPLCYRTGYGYGVQNKDVLHVTATGSSLLYRPRTPIVAPHSVAGNQRNNQVRQRQASPGTFVGEAIRPDIKIVVAHRRQPARTSASLSVWRINKVPRFYLAFSASYLLVSFERGLEMRSLGERYVRQVGGDLVSSIITDTPSMRIEVLRRETVGRIHWHFRQPELSLFLFSQGAKRLRATIDGRPVEHHFFGKSKLAIFPAAIEIEGEWNVESTLDYTVVFLNPAFVGERLQHAITNSTIAFEHDELTRGLAQLCREAASPDDVFHLMAEGWSIQALAHMSRISEGSERRSIKMRGGMSGRSLRRIEDYVRENLTQSICLAELSGVVGLSKRHFLRAFQESVGAPPYSYVLSRRIDEAKRRLSQTNDSIVDVAIATGFSHAQHFSTSFKKATGLTPSGFRQRCLS